MLHNMILDSKISDEKSATIPHLTAGLRDNFDKGVTQSLQYRQKQLQGIDRFFSENESEIKAALYEDLGKPSQEALATEIALVRHETQEAIKNISGWMKPRKVSTLFAAQPGWSHIQAEPLGLVLIISPWNYPFQLSMMPLIGALAAGNCAILKPSELAPASSKLMATLLPKYLDNASFRVVEGAVPETTQLLEEQFDYIFFTGSGPVGKIVMNAAAKHLTPVTLELGGKSPCIVDHDANIDIAAERILWGKFSNAGQTCIAPDYVLVHESVENKLIESMVKKLKDFYGENPEKSPDYSRIINTHHHKRLMDLITDSGDIAVGGHGDEKSRYIEPTILKNVPTDAPIMKKDAEIFGPILPIIKIKSIQEAVKFVKSRPKPLTLYLFSENSTTQDYVEKNTSSGGMVINHTLLSGCVLSLPFGGVGASGMGGYHGKASFDTFSHQKSVFIKPTWKWDISSYVALPPYNERKEQLLRMVL